LAIFSFNFTYDDSYFLCTAAVDIDKDELDDDLSRDKCEMLKEIY